MPEKLPFPIAFALFVLQRPEYSWQKRASSEQRLSFLGLPGDSSRPCASHADVTWWAFFVFVSAALPPLRAV